MYEKDIVALLTADAGAGITAASNLIHHELGSVENGRPLLPWKLAGRGGADSDDTFLELSILGWPRVGAVSLSEFRSAYGRGQSLTGLLLMRTLEEILDGLQTEVPPAEALARSAEAMQNSQARVHDFDERVLVEPPSISRIRTLLNRGNFAGLIGASASGKTVLADLLAKEYEGRGVGTVWLDLADPEATPLGCVVTVMRAPRPQPNRAPATRAPALVICDDIQSNPAAGAALLRLMHATTPPGGRHVLALGWLDARDLIERTMGVGRVLICEGRDVCKRIASAPGIEEPSRRELLSLARSNALIAETALSMFYDSGRMPRPSEVASRMYEVLTGGKRLRETELRVLWLVACLALFEIDLNLTYADHVTRDTVRNLLHGRVLRQRGAYVSFGHRTFARFVVRHIRENRLVDAASSGTPVSLAVAYLRAAGDQQIQITLDRLDLLTLEAREGVNEGNAFLAEAWSSVRILARYIARQVEADASWGDNVASAVFSSEALAELGMLDEWRQVAAYVRGRWTLPDGTDLPEHTRGQTAESVDFVEIIKRMRVEDAAGAGFTMSAEDVDADRFHRTWVLGLLMGFEGSALEPDERRITALRKMVARSQQPDGSFYPSRVPWVTARICIGLCHMGETPATSNVLRQAVRWLLTESPRGPYVDGMWRGGTGEWNTMVNTTALVLLALATAGVEQDERVSRSVASIVAVRDDWTAPGQEVDCAQALEASLLLGESWSSSSEIINHLIHWAGDSRAWDTAGLLASETQDESSKVPYVARALITLIWEAARAELPILLEGISGEEGHGVNAREEVNLASERRAATAQTALSDLSDFIIGQIRDREALLSRGNAVKEVAANWELWRSRATECERLIAALQASRTISSESEVGALLAEIDEFGRAIQGKGWKGLGR